MAESSNDRLRRLLTLVPWLAAHSGVSKADAAAHFGLTVAQLEADLALITVTGPGLYGGELVDVYFDDATVTVYDAQGLLEPVHLTTDESAALLLGLRALQQMPDVDAAIVAGLIATLDGDGTASDLEVRVQPSPWAGVITEAMRQEMDLTIDYLHPVRDEQSRRVVTPSRIVTRDGIDYLHGWCHTAEAVRTFRLDRITACAAVPAGASTPGPAVPEVPRQAATIEVDPASEYLLEHVPAVISSRNGRITATLAYADERWLVQWLIECGSAVRCVQPEHVAEAVAERAQSGLRAYGALS